MSTTKKTVLIITGVFLLLVIFAAAVLPVIIRDQAVKALENATGRNVLIEKVSLNPLTLRVSVDKFSVEERGGGPFFSLGALKVVISPSSIYKRALVLSEVTIDSPSLRIVRAGANRFNFTDVLERLKQAEEKPEEKKPKEGAIFPFVVKNVHLVNGSVEFDDQAVVGGCKHSLKNLKINLPWLSSLPADIDKQTVLDMSTIANGASLSILAKSRPFREDLASSVHIILQKLDLSRLTVYAPHHFPLELASGLFGLDAEIDFRRVAQGNPAISFKGTTRLDMVALNLKNKEPILKLPALEIKAANVEPFAGIFIMESITLDEPEFFVHRYRDGKWMYEELLSFARLKTPKGKTSNSPAAGTITEAKGPSNTTDVALPAAAGGSSVVSKGHKKQPEPPQFSIASFTIKNGRIYFQDDVPPGGFKAEINEVNLASQEITNSPGKTAQYDLSLRVQKNTRVSSTGSFTVAEPGATASVKLTALPLETARPYLTSYFSSPLKGVVNLSGDIAFSNPEGLSVNNGHLDLKKFSVSYGEGEGIELATLTVDGATFRQQKNDVRIERINLSGGDISLSRDSDGTLSVQSLIIPKETGKTKEIPSTTTANGPKKSESPKPFVYHLKRVGIDQFKVAFMDKSREGSPRFSLRDLKLSLADLRGPDPQFAKMVFSSLFGEEATIALAGDIMPAPFCYRGNLKIGRLPVRDFESYYPETFNFRVLGGFLDVDTTLDIALKDGVPVGSFKGNAGVGLLHVVDSVEEEDLLKWKRLQLDGIDGDIKPLRLVVGQVSLNEVYSRIIVRENGTINLQDLIKKEQTDSPKTEPADEDKKSSQAQTPSKKENTPNVRVGAVTIANGTVKFTDKHLPNDFETTFYNLDGRLSGLSSEFSTVADVELRGNLENHSPLLIAGKINPLRGDLFVDLKLTFSDIELSPMSPYSETYLGYILKQGKLFLDLKYHIENKKLVSENRVRVDQFTFGDKVESDKATSLPVKLGLALLKDRNGEIKLDIPVTGSLDDPRFNIWRIVFQVIKNLLVKAVTAPFSLLSSLFGGEGDLGVVFFAPGSSTLNAAEQKKLEALAKALNDRPALKMSITAYVDRERDSEAWQKELFERKLKREKFLTLTKKGKIAAGESVEAISVAPQERTEYIKSVYAKEKFPKPRDAKGAQIKLPEQEMVKLILANIKVEKDELEDLARERSDAVKNFLVQKAGIEAQRVFEKSDDLFKEPKKSDALRSRVELNAVAQ